MEEIYSKETLDQANELIQYLHNSLLNISENLVANDYNKALHRTHEAINLIKEKKELNINNAENKEKKDE